jgi:YidC/Oxa1 family membrane protein insertase
MPCSTDLRDTCRHVTLFGQEVIVGKRCLVLTLIWIVFLAVVAAGADDRIVPEVKDLDGDGFDEVLVSAPEKGPLAEYVFSEEGGVMKSLFLTFAPYGATVEELVPGMRTEDDGERSPLADVEYPFTLLAEGLDEGEYVYSGPAYPEPGVLVIEFVGAFGDVTVTKTYTFHEDAVYTVGFRLTVENAGPPFDLDMLLGKQLDVGESPELYYLYDDEPSTDRLAADSGRRFDGIGYMSKAIVFFLSPSDGTNVLPLSEYVEGENRRFGVTMTIDEGASTFDFSLYGGRRRYLLMEDAGLETLDQPGIGARLMIPVIQFLEMLYRATGNYGWAIILFTILSRIILFPLMRKQYHSMAKMQKLQPKMKRIQARFKDDRQLLQQKTMELYRKEGVNPMSGCLPLLIQLPILILIWRAILYSGELIHLSPGFLWMPDLSLYDPYFILVIVTTGIMMLQQWLMTPATAEASGSQKYFGYIFPLFMAVLLWRFPAGLWLYYLLTTASQVVQQAIANREMARADARLAPEAAEEESDETGDSGDGSESGG